MFPAILRKIGCLVYYKKVRIFLGSFKATMDWIPIWYYVSCMSYLMLTTSYEVSTITYFFFQVMKLGLRELTHPGSNRKWQSRDSNSELWRQHPWSFYGFHILLFFFFFHFSFKKETGIKLLRYPKMESAGRTQRFVPVLMVNQNEPHNSYLWQHLQKWSLNQ